jgi:hypothetical protein
MERQVDIGLLAETIFFYQSVQLVLNRSSVIALASKLPLGDLVALLNRTRAKLTYVQPGFGVVSAGMPRTHQFVSITMAAAPHKKIPNYKEEISTSLEKVLGSGAGTRKVINALNDRLVLHRFKESSLKEKIIPDLARQDVSDPQFVQQAAIAVLRNLVPSYSVPADTRFELFDTGSGYAICTDIDFARLNSFYHLTVPPSHSSLTPEYLLAHIIDARSDSYFAANYMAEIVTAPIYSDIIRLKHFEFMRRRGTNEGELALFQETILQDFPSIRDVVNSGERTISEFLNLLDRAERFKEWLKNANSDSGLVRSYYKASTTKTWADLLPTKSVRFVCATGLGLLADAIMPTGVGTATGLGVGAADSLYLDRLIKGWRPNQFIEGPYRAFATSSGKPVARTA